MAIVRRKGFGGKSKKRLRDPDVKYKLPEKRSVPSDALQDYSILIYGKKKIGKTSLAAQFEDTLFLMCEPGGKSLSIFKVDVRNWRELREYTRLAIKDDRFRTIVVDTADYSYEYCMDYVCDKLVMDHPSDEGYGKGWKAVRAEYTDWVNDLLHSGKGVIFISHSKDEEFKTRKKDSFHKVVSSMSGQAKDVLEGLIDIWVNYDYDGRKRILTIQGNDEIDAGHRLQNHFRYPDGSLIEKVSMGKNPKEGYKNFMDAFNNHLEQAGEKVVIKKKKLKIRS